MINYTEPIILCDLHIKLASTYLCVRRGIVREKCTLKAVRTSEWMVLLVRQKFNRKVYGENGFVNVAKVEAMQVIWKRAGDNTILPVLITLSSARISCVYSLPNSPKYSADGIQLQIREVA